MHAVARLVLHGLIDNIQASWVKMGEQGVAACLKAGVNDLGGTLMNESITRAAGSGHGQEWAPTVMERQIRGGGPPAAHAHHAVRRGARESAARAAFAAPPLAAVDNATAGKAAAQQAPVARWRRCRWRSSAARAHYLSHAY